MTASANKMFFARTVYLMGTGLIGGSLAMDLKGRGLAVRILGSDAHKPAEDLALERGIIDEVAPPTEDVLGSCDLVVLAVPVLALARILSRGFPRGPLVTDVGSVKGPLVRAFLEAEEAGRPFRYVPGHPIAGDERSGPGAARAGLFSGARVVLTPSAGIDPDVETVERMWRAVGANVTIMTPSQHDEVFAWVSHLPHMAAFALVDAILDREPAWIALSGGGLKDYTRVAGSSAGMWADIAIANKEPLLDAMNGLGRGLERIRSAIEKGDRVALEGLFANVAAARRGM